MEVGADALTDALQRAVDEAGTVAMPAFTFQPNELPDPAFDVRYTAVWASTAYERVRQDGFPSPAPLAAGLPRGL